MEKKEIYDVVHRAKDKIDILYAIELLEYHDKNFLAYDTKRLNEEKQNLLIDISMGLKSILIS